MIRKKVFRIFSEINMKLVFLSLFFLFFSRVYAERDEGFLLISDKLAGSRVLAKEDICRKLNIKKMAAVVIALHHERQAEEAEKKAEEAKKQAEEVRKLAEEAGARFDKLSAEYKKSQCSNLNLTP